VVIALCKIHRLVQAIEEKHPVRQTRESVMMREVPDMLGCNCSRSVISRMLHWIAFV